MIEISAQIAFSGSTLPDTVRRSADAGESSPYMRLSGPTVDNFGDIRIAMSGQPRVDCESAPSAVASRIVEQWRAKGTEFLGEIRGPFALVIVDISQQKCVIAIDRMGVERLAWGHYDGHIALGTSASEVARLLSRSPTLNSQALFDFMFTHMVPAPATVFRGVRKLLPGTAMEFTAHGHRSFRFWKPDFCGRGVPEVEELCKQTLPILRRAIQRTKPDDATGTFLSGGLDSSTVTGLLADIQSTQTRAFSVGFGVDEFDEMEFARAAAVKFDCKHLIYEVTPSDIVDLIPRIAAAYDEPFGNSSAVPTYCCARLAREHGIDHLLAGDGGDELFGGNERYVRHRIFEAYFRLPAWLRNRALEPIADRIDPETGLFPFRKGSSYVRQARIPLPERFESWNLVYREGVARIFSGDFLREVDPDHVFDSMRDVWQSCSSTDLLDRMLWYDWKFTLADNDLRKVSRMCDLAGVRVSFPMLDEEFVEHSIRVPSSEKIRRYELRTFFKNAVRDFVPDVVISKKKHGFGLPFGVWLKSHSELQDLVYGSIERLRLRGIFDDAFLNRVVAEHRDGHAGYYGYAIWDLAMLEQWLEYHGP